jgi:hypothetical protein
MDVYAIIGSDTYKVNTDGLYLAGHSGLGDFPLYRLTQRGAQQHGDTDVGWRSDPRVFELAFESTYGIRDLYVERSRLRRLFAPQNDLRLRFELANGDTREIACHRREAALPMQSPGALKERLVYQFRAANPFLVDPTQQSATWTLNVVSSVILPTTLPTFFGSSIINDTQTIAYLGDVDEYPVITIQGPLTNPIVEQQTTDEMLVLEYALAAGQAVEIDCRYGYKRVTLTGGTQLVLTDESDLGTFHLAAQDNGSTDAKDNVIRVFGTGAVSGQTSVSIAYYNTYGGI